MAAILSHRRLLAGLALTLGCAACGGSGGSSTAASSPSTGTAPTAASAAPGPSGAASGAPAGAPTAAPVLSPVPAVVTQTQPAVPISATSTFGHKVTARITGHKATTSDAHGPGQTAGAPSVSFTVVIDNGDSRPVPLDGVTVTASYGASAVPATLSDGTTGFTGQLKAGAKATGTYAFEIPVAERGAVTVTVSYLPSEPTVVFTGSVA